MVTKQELVNGYERNQNYQRHMLENLGRWFNTLYHCHWCGIDLSLSQKFPPLLILRDLPALIGILGMIVLDMASTVGGSIFSDR